MKSRNNALKMLAMLPPFKDREILVPMMEPVESVKIKWKILAFCSLLIPYPPHKIYET
jgi:hypothetical protein